MKKLLCLLLVVLLVAAGAACHKIQPTDASPENTAQAAEAAADVQTMTAYRADGSSVTLEDCGDGTWKDADGTLYYLGEDGVLRARGADDLYTEIPSGTEEDASAPAAAAGRQDGERFETVVMIEGMEETVRYEHIRNDALGFEMDYDYERFARYHESVCERFVSVYDDPDDPQNYFELSFSAADPDTILASVCSSLSDDYEIIQESYTLERAGSCIRIDASNGKGNTGTPDFLQTVYIIPAADGCRIVTAHYYFESAEGLGRRVSYMLDTLEIIERDPDSADAADYDGQPAEDTSQWTGMDFGELPPEDFEGWGDDGQDSTDTSQWTGRDFGELPPEDFEGWGDNGQDATDTSQWTGRDYGELPPEDFEGWGDDGQDSTDTSQWTGRDFGELPPEDFYTGVDYGELPPEDFGG